MTDAIVTVLRALIDAAFSTGGINDAQHEALHGKLNAAAEAEATPDPTEAASPATAPPDGPAQEAHPYA